MATGIGRGTIIATAATVTIAATMAIACTAVIIAAITDRRACAAPRMRRTPSPIRVLDRLRRFAIVLAQ
jgi:hypothetical protein